MGRTTVSYRMAIEEEISSTWMKFARMLRREERPLFDNLISKIRYYTSEASAAAFPSIVEGMFLSAIFAHTKELNELRITVERVQKIIEELKNQRLAL